MTLKNFILTAFLAVMTACNPGVFVNDIGPSAKELTFSAAGEAKEMKQKQVKVETKEIRFNSSDWGIIEVRAGMNVLNVTVYPDNDEPFTTTFPKLYGTGRIIVDFGDGSEWKIVRPTGKSMVITSGRNNMSYYRCFSIILSNNVSQESIDILQKSGSPDADGTGPVPIELNDDQDNDQTPSCNIYQI